MNAVPYKSISGKQITAVVKSNMLRFARFLKLSSLIVLFAGLGAVTSGYAQSLSVTAEVLPGAPGRLLMQGSGSPHQRWSFRDSYGGILGLGNRVRGFQLLDATGKQVAVRRIAPGQFASAVPATNFKYEIELAAAPRAADAALTSWLGTECGVLMFGDLLPESPASPAGAKSAISVHLALPLDWAAYAGDAAKQQTQFEIVDDDHAAVVVGKKIRVLTRESMRKPFILVTSGEWAFSDNDALDVAMRVLHHHSNNVGESPCDSASLVLLPIPQATAANKWSAQTRGCAVTLLMGRVPSKVGALSQLELALTHELFHFWVPNGLGLTGDYDWFYEGFTMYEAARAAVRLDLISFEQFLNAIADAYDGSSGRDAQDLSLIEASKQRWTGGYSTVYSKAMVVAFLYDLNLRWKAKGKRSLDDVYRTIVQNYAAKQSLSAPAPEANSAVVGALRLELSDQDFVNRLVLTRATIDLQKELAPFGLRVERPGVRTHISTDSRLAGRQRDLLKQLGYNEPRR